MKGFKRLAAIVLGIVMIFGILQFPVKAQAAEAQHFEFTYDATNTRWLFTTDGKSYTENLNKFTEYFKEGDIIAVVGDGSAPELRIKANFSASEIGVSNALANITVDGADNVYAVEGATAVINGNVKKATCYPGNVLQINGDCEEFTAVYDSANIKYPVFAVTGKVAKAHVIYTESTRIPEDIYSIPAGKFISSGIGGIWLEKTDYSKVPPTSGNNNSGNKNNKGELDDVPKTGYGLAGSVVFFMLSAVCAAAGVALKKTAVR